MHFLNRITLQTPESVELEFLLAGIGNRALALLIDYIVWGSMLLAFMITLGIFNQLIVSIFQQIFGDQANLWLSAIALMLFFLIYVGYFVFFEVIWQGQTPGKRYTKIRVIRDDGRRESIQQALLRALLRPVDDLLTIGFFLILLGKQEKRLGDIVAGTLVIQEEYLVTASFPISPQGEQFVMELLQTANISQLQPDDFALIRDYLQRQKNISPKAKAELSLNLARQTRAIIDLQKLPPGLTPHVFLEAVYLAYQKR
jgi:uncharacterized RDD family membrane protein YckC